jgi:adenylate cyclase
VHSLRLLYLDLDSRVYCNELLALPAECSTSPAADLRWGARESIGSLRRLMGDSDYRRRDLQLVLSPDLADEALTEEELEQQTDAAAVLNVRSEVEKNATISILQTTLVMLTITISVYLYTKDLTFLSSNLLKPLVDLSDEMESITRLQMAGVAASQKGVDEAEESHHVKGTSEIRLIKSSFENMKKAIRSWGKYVPWPVVQLLLRQDAKDTLEVSEKEVSIFFSDIAGFTGIVEGLPPEKSLLLLSRYFHDMSKVIDSYEGIVLEYIGDAIMSVYGAPIPNVDHPTAAVKSALKMLSCLKVMNRWFSERGLPNISIRCGVHTGCVLVGNMGFEKRLKYGVVGDESNVPSRLEELNKSYGTEMLISQATFERLAKGSFVTRPIDVIYIMSGESQLVYQVFNRDNGKRTSALREACDLHAEAIEQYLQRNFSEARAKFAEVLKRMGDLEMDEKASEVFMGRCDEYLARPPPEDWDGVWEGN